MIQYYTDREKLGALGEKLVAKLENAILSENKYDSEKDMIDSNGRKIEVKTQNRHPYKKCFSIDAKGLTNVRKCMTVDRLIFVEYDKTDIIQIWECTENKTSSFNYTTSTNKVMYGWHINKMKLIHKIEDAKLAEEMRSFSRSYEFK